MSAATALTRPRPSILSARPNRAAHLVERSFYAYRQNWVFIVSGFFEPFFYLLSISVGISHLVGPIYFDGHLVPYPHYVAPGLLATSAMNGAALDTTYNFFFKLKIAKSFDAVVATPLGVADVALGEVGWAVCRGSIYSSAFLVVMAAFGLISSPWAVLCLPAAMLIALCFASIGIAASSHMRTWQDLSGVTLAMLPLFLFSGTFFKITIYPPVVRAIVEVTPLYQGIVICRSLCLGTVSPELLLRAAYLGAIALVGVSVAARRLGRLLTP